MSWWGKSSLGWSVLSFLKLGQNLTLAICDGRIELRNLQSAVRVLTGDINLLSSGLSFSFMPPSFVGVRNQVLTLLYSCANSCAVFFPVSSWLWMRVTVLLGEGASSFRILSMFQSLFESLSRFREAVFRTIRFCLQECFLCELSRGFTVICCILVEGVVFHVASGSVNSLDNEHVDKLAKEGRKYPIVSSRRVSFTRELLLGSCQRYMWEFHIFTRN